MILNYYENEQTFEYLIKLFDAKLKYIFNDEVVFTKGNLCNE